MKPQDLRIGNLVTINQTALHFDGSGESESIFEIGEIRTDLVYFKGFHTGEYCSSLQPMPLTEGWLLTLGFTIEVGKHGVYYMHSIFKGFRVWKSDITSCWVIGRKQFDNNLTYWIADLKYVHQLQNIFYSLTGEELEVKL